MKQAGYTPGTLTPVPVRAVLAAEQERHIIRIVVLLVFISGYGLLTIVNIGSFFRFSKKNAFSGCGYREICCAL